MSRQTRRKNHEKIKEVFSAVIELPIENRDEFLQTACGNDEVLCRAVKALLGAHAKAGEFLEDISAIGVIQDSMRRNDQLTDELIDKYRIVKEIGRGGMGIVFLATREDFHQQVAIKLIKRGMDSDAILERFAREREILAALNHPFIARLTDGGTTDDGLPFFVMEYVEGVPVDEYCKTKNLSEKEILELFCKVGEAVRFAHQKLIIHRDLKPSNILVTSDGTPKLLDFGIAKLLNTDDTASTQTNQRVLTPAYASPEQTSGEPVDTTSDVYSLGKILAELLQPDSKSNSKTTYSNKSRTTNNSHLLLSTDLQAVLQTALRNERSRRYSSVEKFVDDIHRYQRGLPVSARRDTFAYRAKKFVQRNYLTVSGAALFLLISIVGLAFIMREHNKSARRFNDVRKLAHTFIFDYNDAVVYLPGSTPLRRRMVKDALEYLDSLSKEASGDTSLQQEIAEAYIRVGDMQGRSTTPNLGDTKGAFDNYQKATTILEKLNANDPKNSEISNDLAICFERLGEINTVFGKPAEAAQFYRQSLNILEALYISAPDDLELQSLLGYTNRLLGQVLGVPPAANLGDTKGALEHLQKAATLIETVPVEKLPANAKRPFGLVFDKKYDLASIYAETSVVLEAIGDKAECITYQQKAVTLLETRLAEEPDNAIARRSLAINYGNLGTDMLNGNDAGAALLLYRKSLAIEESLAAADENNLDARKDVATGYRNMGKALAATKDKTAASQSYRKAISIFEDLVAKDQSNAFMRRNLAFTYLKMSQLLSETGELNEAIIYAQKSASICEELVAAEAKNLTAQNTLAQTYTQLGDCDALLAVKATGFSSQQIDDLNKAEEWYRKSLNIWQEMKAQGTLSIADSGKPDEVSLKIAKCDEALSNRQK